ncbi:CHAT domain-containing protein [Aetokthonos hydrillicola Thurmond2011]|uniref:CHAT domain-containing protein n=3 Tax=Aetokthonos TaxID=1550243 RepID=A0AAP5IE53_9CYAN|nr:CHAT domain-containing protein [Aetokthonos hydrillicola CCALA 1050]MDR9898689.1 CHAT domain-containing protein [Aetokthonos hydrillicola Thurmond2011]
MRSYKLGLLRVSITLLTAVSTSFATNPAAFTVSQVLAQTTNEQKTQADQLFQQGRQQYKTSKFQAASQSWQQALMIYRQIKDRKSEGKALGNLGLAYLHLGDYAKAIDYEQQYLAIARQIKDRQGEGAALGDLGLVYDSLGEYAKAIDYQQQALTIVRELKDHKGEGAALGNLGRVYLSLGDYAKAIKYQQQALAIARQLKDLENEGAALGNLGNAYYLLGDYTKAIDYQQEALTIARQIKDHQSEGAALGNLGNAYYLLGDYIKAIDYQQQHLAISRQIQDRQGEGAALGNLGNAYYLLGDYTKAIDYQQQHLAISRQIQDRQSEGIALNNLGYALYKKGNLVLAEKTLFEGITVLESVRGKLDDRNKVSIFETQRNIYNSLQQVLIAQNKTDAALEVAERGRARAFVELLASRSNSQILSGSPTIQQIKQIAKQQSSTLVQYSIIYDDFKISGKQQYKESELYIWVIKPTGEVTFRKTGLKPVWQKYQTNLAQLVTTSRDFIAVSRDTKISYNPTVSKAQNQFKYLHKLLIQPIADLLPKKEGDRVIFIPQSSLFMMPFPALQDEEGKYLIEKHTMLTSPSIQVLGLTRNYQQKKRSQEPLVVGNPIMPYVSAKIGEPPKQLPPLPGAEQEASAIASLLKTQPLIGKDATKAAILQRLPTARIAHFATHGILDDVQGLNSAIALAPSSSSGAQVMNLGNDGLLTSQEILNLKLSAELVVLSACDTGRGRITGDGVIGLSRSLISAGTPSVIVSLWAIDDGSTKFLMTEFYKNLQQKIDKATALRRAMLATKLQYGRPSDWAAFTLIGQAK